MQVGGERICAWQREGHDDGAAVDARELLANSAGELNGGGAVGDSDEHAGPQRCYGGRQVSAGGTLVAVRQRMIR